MPAHRDLDQDFFKTWTPEMAYMLGYFAADGSMIRNKRGAHFIEFTTTDRILLMHLKRVSGAAQRISVRVKRNENWKRQYRLQIGSKKWFSDLINLGFTQSKSGTLRFPEIPGAYFGNFVRGYFDGDGCVYFKRHYSKSHRKQIWVLVTLFTSGSQPFLQNLHERLLQRGVIGGHIAKKSNGYELVFSRRDSLALCRIMYNTADIADLWLPRKRKKLEKAIQVLGLDK